MTLRPTLLLLAAALALSACAVGNQHNYQDSAWRTEVRQATSTTTSSRACPCP